jgi:hypothetical protein
MSAIAEPIVSSRDALPVYLFENSHGLVSLADMLPFIAYDFTRASSMLGQLYAQCRSGVSPTSGSWSLIASELGCLERECAALGLTNTLSQIKRIKPVFFDNASPGYDFPRDILDVQLRLNDELRERKVFMLDGKDARYFEAHGFPAMIGERFPQAIYDMEEAGKCLALERATACAFHLMRVTEYGLQALGKKVGIAHERPDWEPVIRKIDAELKKPYAEREYKGMADFLAHASAHLNAVKVAWRNRVMHVERKHTIEEAREIYLLVVSQVVRFY